MFGVQPVLPKSVVTEESSSVLEIKPDASIRLLNAVVRYQIDQLESKELVRFSDSMMHVMMYLSGGSPVKSDLYDRAGWWKLSYPVALRYGLIVNEYVDERYNFEKSTKVAMAYAKDLQKDFPQRQWLLAFIDGPVVASRSNAKVLASSLEYSLAALYKLMITSNYTAAEDYAVQHFYSSVKTYKVDELILSELVIEKTGMPEDVFASLNPELKGAVIPAKTNLVLTDLAVESLKRNMEDIVLLSNARIEEKNGKIIVARKQIANSQPDPRTHTSNYYQVKKGDNLGVIAERFGVKIGDLKTWNNLRGNVIYVGQKLVVYSNKERKAATFASSSQEKSTAKTPTVEIKSGEFITYKVKSGDTLYSIAKQFPGVSADNLMAWNGIGSSIRVGQRIKILKSEIRDYSNGKYPDQL